MHSDRRQLRTLEILALASRKKGQNEANLDETQPSYYQGLASILAHFRRQNKPNPHDSFTTYSGLLSGFGHRPHTGNQESGTASHAPMM